MFDLGEIKPTKLALKKAKACGLSFDALLSQHSNEEWPFLTEYEKLLNKKALERGGIVYSRFKCKDQVFLAETNMRINETYIKMVEEI